MRTTEETTGNDVNIWEEPISSETIRYTDKTEKKVASGTLNQLVRMLTSDNELGMGNLSCCFVLSNM